MDLSRAKATFAILCGAAGLALTAGHLNIRPARPEIVHFASNAAFRDGLYQGKLDAQHGSKPHIRSARWSASQIGWHSFPGTSSDIRTAKLARIALTSFGERCSEDQIHAVILSSQDATAAEHLAERRSFAVGSKPGSSARGRRQTFCLSPRHVALALESRRPVRGRRHEPVMHPFAVAPRSYDSCPPKVRQMP